MPLPHIKYFTYRRVLYHNNNENPVFKQKIHHNGCIFCLNWLCSVCSSRTELLEIGREIDEVKKNL